MSFTVKRAGFLAGVALCVLGLAAPAGAATPIDGSGTLHCTVVGTVKYKPALKLTDAGTGTTTLKTTLTCTSGTGDGAHVISGKSTTITTHPKTDCPDVLQPAVPQPGTGTIKWKAAKGTPKLNPSSVTLQATGGTGDATTPVTLDSSGPVNAPGSFKGDTASSHAEIQESYNSILASCAGKGLKILHIITNSSVTSTLDLS